MGPVAYFGLCLLGCLLFNPTVEGARNRSLALPRSPCPPGVLYYRKTCYEFLDDPMRWQEAEDSCQFWRKAHLASIHSAEEEKTVTDYIKRSVHVNHVWIGLKAATAPTKLVWRWSDNSHYIPGSPLWDGRRPSLSLSNNQCISLYNVCNPGATTRWTDIHCNRNFPYVCKYPAAY